MFQMHLTDAREDFEQIIALNKVNNREAVDEKLWASEGFLSLEFGIEQLERMRGSYKHVVAKSQGQVIGYTLVLLKENREVFPFFDPMFETITAAVIDGSNLRDLNYFVMAQICVEKKFRGKGVFNALYQKLANQMKSDYNKVVIEVSPKNIRSMNAHRRVGFEIIKNEDYQEELVEWNVMIWNLEHVY